MDSFRHCVGAKGLAVEDVAGHDHEEQQRRDNAAADLADDMRNALHRRRDPGGHHGARDRWIQVAACSSTRGCRGRRGP